MSFTEAKMQGLFTRWLKRNKWDECVAFELKICKEKSLPFSRIEEHQLYYLHKGTKDGFPYKLSDQSMGMKPWDCMYFIGKGYIVVMFYEPRKEKVAYIIDIKTWIWYKDTQTKKKSITEQECRAIAFKEITL